MLAYLSMDQEFAATISKAWDDRDDPTQIGFIPGLIFGVGGLVRLPVQGWLRGWATGTANHTFSRLLAARADGNPLIARLFAAASAGVHTRVLENAPVHPSGDLRRTAVSGGSVEGRERFEIAYRL